MTNHRHDIITTILLLAAVLLAGCSGDDITPSDENRGGEMCFDVKSEQLMRGDTRATIINSNSDLQNAGENISITAYFHGTINRYLLADVPLRHVNGNWTFVDGSNNPTHYYWPIEGSVYYPLPANPAISLTYTSLDFVGFWPRVEVGDVFYMGTDYNVTYGPELTCENLPVTSAGQVGLKEFMYAYVTGKRYVDQEAAGGRLPLVFRHPLATVKFQLAAGHTPDVVITSITVPGIKNNGSGYNAMSTTWTPTGDDANLVITGNPATGDTPYLVVPQTVGTKTITAEVTWEEWGVSQNHTLTTNVDFGTWQPGYIYTYTFTVNAHELIVNVTKFTEQW